MKARRSYGEWAGCAWYRAAGLNKLVQGDDDLDRTAVSDPAKYLFSERKNIVRTTLGVLEKTEFQALEQEKLSLYELLVREGVAEGVERKFGIDPATLAYRGPVVVGWQHYPKRRQKENTEGARKPRLANVRTRRSTEKIYWLGILPRRVIDLRLHARDLKNLPEGRALLLRNAFDLFTDPPSNPEELPDVSVDPRVAVRTAVAFRGGTTLETDDDYDLVRELDLGDGRRSYFFWYDGKIQPRFNQIVSTLGVDDRIAWYRDAATADAVPDILAKARQYTGQAQILAFSRDMAAGVLQMFPWAWNQTAKGLKTIRGSTADDSIAQGRMVILAGALAALLGHQVRISLLRQAWMKFGTPPDFDATLEHLAHGGLLLIGGLDQQFVFGEPIAPALFIARDDLFGTLQSVVEWLWSEAELAFRERGIIVKTAVITLQQLLPEYGSELYARWQHDFPNHPSVLIDALWSATRAQDWSAVRSLAQRLIAAGESSMVDVVMRNVFTFYPPGVLSVETLLDASQVALDIGRGLSYGVQALLPYYQQADVAAFVRMALEKPTGGLFFLLRDLSDRDPKLARFILDIAARAPMDDLTREQFDAAVLRMRAIEAESV
jgi:hypothetical protein